MEKKNRYYSVNGKGKYLASEADENGMCKCLSMHGKKREWSDIHKSKLQPWKKPTRVTYLKPKFRL